LDCILFYRQKDLFVKEHTSMSVYQIFQMLHIDGPNPTSLLPGAISLAETVLRPFQ
jgi:hypothetical protein